MNKLTQQKKEEIFNYLMEITKEVGKKINPKPEESPPINNSKNASWYLLMHAQQLMIGAYCTEISLDEVYGDGESADKLKSIHPIFLRCLIDTHANTAYIKSFEGESEEEQKRALNGMRVSFLGIKDSEKAIKALKVLKKEEDINKDKYEELIKQHRSYNKEAKEEQKRAEEEKAIKPPEVLEEKILQGWKKKNPTIIRERVGQITYSYSKCHPYIHASPFVAGESFTSIKKIYEIYTITLLEFENYLKKEEGECLEHLLRSVLNIEFPSKAQQKKKK